MNILQTAYSKIINALSNLDPRKYVWGFARPTNVFESPKQAMFASVEPRQNMSRMTEWRARYIGVKAAETPDEAFFDMMDNIAEQIAICQGLRMTHRFGSMEIQTRIMRAEDRLRDAMETLYSVRPEDEEYIEAATGSFDDSHKANNEVPNVPPFVSVKQEKKEHDHAVH